MNLSGKVSSQQQAGLSRTRGSEPITQITDPKIHKVFPAHAGVNPWRQRLLVYVPSLSRTRGSEPFIERTKEDIENHEEDLKVFEVYDI